MGVGAVKFPSVPLRVQGVHVVVQHELLASNYLDPTVTLSIICSNHSVCMPSAKGMMLRVEELINLDC